MSNLDDKAFYTRESLYEAVWTMPLIKVARSVGMSDVALGKLCRRHRIPVPGRGYWAKIEAGQAPRKSPLPAHGDYVRLEIIDEELLGEKECLEARAAEIIARIEKAVPVENCSALHPALRQVERELSRKGRPVDHKGLPKDVKDIYGMIVTHAASQRAMGLLNAVFIEADRLGWSPKLDRRSGITLCILGVEIPVGLEERVARVPHVKTEAEKRAERRRHSHRPELNLGFVMTPQYDYLASGDLKLVAGRPGGYPLVSWGDTPKRRLEQRLGDVLRGLVSLAVDRSVKHFAERRRRIAYEAAEKRYREYQERLDGEKARFATLESESLQHEKAVRIRLYISAVRAQYADPTVIPENVLEWLSWAEQKADWVDPLVQCSDVILDAPEIDPPRRW